ncbi:MAG: two-component system sensor histidine kinase NtrB [Planktomarina sp.]
MSFDTHIWSNLPIPALVVDDETCITDANPSAEVFFNLSRRALLDSPLWDRLHVAAPLDASMERVRREETPLFVNDVDVSTGDRAPVLCSIQVAPMARGSGQLLVLVQPRESGHRLTNGASQTAAKSAIGMAEMLAHEIKNPLAGITGAAQLLSMNLSADDLELTDLIVSETRRIVKLLDQVEQFGRLRPPRQDALNIHDVLDRVRQSAQVGFGAHMLIVEDYDPSLPPTVGDQDQLVQVFMNLVKNASEAQKGQGAITLRSYYEHSLRVQLPDGRRQTLPLQIEIIDDGPGLPEDISGMVFEPFVSGRENGTGLGLALVSKIITDHGGWVSVDSIPGRTVFKISLPIAKT